MRHKVVTMCYVVCEKCFQGSPAEHNKKDAISVAKQVGWKVIKGKVICDDCQKKSGE